jgi:8-oxo-dGTP pyrophosphatase MutT (NUDIX family)
MIQKIVVAGFLCERGRVLLARRALGKAIAPGEYHLPGGHVEFGEEVPAALARELREELGAAVEVLDPYFTFSYLTPPETHTIGVVCLARLLTPPEGLAFDPRETAETAWAEEGELTRYLSPESHNYRAALLGFRLASRER